MTEDEKFWRMVDRFNKALYIIMWAIGITGILFFGGLIILVIKLLIENQ